MSIGPLTYRDHRWTPAESDPLEFNRITIRKARETIEALERENAELRDHVWGLTRRCRLQNDEILRLTSKLRGK